MKATFFASMISDEGRFPIVSLMTYRKDSDHKVHLPFTTPVPVSAQEIAKLSHAAGDSNHLRLFTDNGRVFIGAIQVTVLDEFRQFGYSSFRTGNPLKLVILGPGHLEVSTGGIALIFKAGEIFEEMLFPASDAAKALGRSVASELAGKTKGKIESVEDIFNDLLRGIIRLGHGGLLLVAKNPDVDEFSSYRGLDSNLLQELLIRYWNDADSLLAASGGVAPWLGRGNQRAKAPQLLKVASDTTMLENCIGSIANLAGMDGAIVMDYSCRVVGFNAIISKTPAGAENAILVDCIGHEIADAAVIASRGSRHQSALAYSKRVPDSFAFVISQDGRVTTFHNQGDGTVRYEGGLRALS